MRPSLPALRLALAVCALVAQGCGGGTPLGTGATGRRAQTVRVAAPPDEAYRAAGHLAAEWGWEVGFFDDQMRIIQAHAPGNMHRAEDEVEIVVARVALGSIVTVRSGLTHSLNVEHVRSYLAELEGRLLAW